MSKLKDLLSSDSFATLKIFRVCSNNNEQISKVVAFPAKSENKFFSMSFLSIMLSYST